MGGRPKLPQASRFWATEHLEFATYQNVHRVDCLHQGCEEVLDAALKDIDSRVLFGTVRERRRRKLCPKINLKPEPGYGPCDILQGLCCVSLSSSRFNAGNTQNKEQLRQSNELWRSRLK